MGLLAAALAVGLGALGAGIGVSFRANPNEMRRAA